jgi:hypothetical protein
MPVRGADGNVVMLPLQLGVFEVNQQGGGALPVLQLRVAYSSRVG